MKGDIINRDISWVKFNSRVLYQGVRDKHISLTERLKFIGISSSNLDEFLMVRVSDALQNDKTLYNKLWKDVKSFKVYQEGIFLKNVSDLEKSKIRISDYKSLDDASKKHAEVIFKNIYPMIVPMAYSQESGLPPVRSKDLCLLVILEDGNVCMIQLSNLSRLHKLKDKDGYTIYITVEELVSAFLESHLFIGKKVKYSVPVRILRQASMILDKDVNRYIVDRMKDVLRDREQSPPICIEVSDKSLPTEYTDLICEMFNIDKSIIYKTNNLLDYRFLIGKPFDIGGDYEEFEQHLPSTIWNRKGIFRSIDKGDVILHHPFESFEPVVRFISDAADDPDVVGIRQTLYRVSSTNSPIIEALCRAASKGKDVSVLLEIKARFDEEQNMSLVDKLTKAGCKVICGVEEYKTHAKFALVVKRVGKDSYRCYAHIGTGNYNDVTSNVYTDISLFTSNSKICYDLLHIFNVLSGRSEPQSKVEKIKFAPYNFRETLMTLIDREVENVVAGKKGLVILKVNSISDDDIINRIYEASKKGVVFNIICRGICSIKPINKNIKIKSVIGRFLEHSRVYYFYNNANQEIYISSADLLTRNLDRRIEILVPVTTKKCKNQIYRILSIYLQDESNSFIMTKTGVSDPPKDGPGYDAHEVFIRDVVDRSRITKKEFKIARRK